MKNPNPSGAEKKRLVWIDLAKGIGILWVVYFHFFTNYIETEAYARIPTPTAGGFVAAVAGEHGWDGVAAGLQTACKVVWLGVSQVGFHAVGLFILLGGWALAATTWRKAEKESVAWFSWYGARFVRLYPMYWVAHLLLLLTPFTWLEPIDHRFLVSLTGLRFLQPETTFYYGNAAWWYFSMLVQLYLVFPALFSLMRRIGLAGFLGLALCAGLGMRYLLLVQWQSNGLWVLGANCLSRLPEFALGMVLGVLHLQNRDRMERLLTGVPALAAGLVLYLVSRPIYSGTIPYIFADLYTAVACSLVVIGTGRILERSAFLTKYVGQVGAFSFGLYLTHQPLVTWLGQRVKNVSVPAFLLISAALLVALSSLSIHLERAVNQLTEHVLRRRKEAGAAQTL